MLYFGLLQANRYQTEQQAATTTLPFKLVKSSDNKQVWQGLDPQKTGATDFYIFKDKFPDEFNDKLIADKTYQLSVLQGKFNDFALTKQAFLQAK